MILGQMQPYLASKFGLVLVPKAEKKDTIEFGKPICDPWGQTTRAKNAQSWPQVCFGPHS